MVARESRGCQMMRTMSGGLCPHYDCSNRNSFGYCQTTVCINEHYQQEQWGLQPTTNKFESVTIKQQTNADRIRTMSDQNLANLFSNFRHEHWCPPNAGDCVEYCADCWLDWLKKVEENKC